MSTENQISQKSAVIAAVTQVLGSAYDANVSARDLLSAEQLTEVKNIVSNGILAGRVAFSKANAGEKEIRRYVAGLVDNHLRKARELNGGNKYVATTTRGPRTQKAANAETTTKRSRNSNIDMSV